MPPARHDSPARMRASAAGTLPAGARCANAGRGPIRRARGPRREQREDVAHVPRPLHCRVRRGSRAQLERCAERGDLALALSCSSKRCSNRSPIRCTEPSAAIERLHHLLDASAPGASTCRGVRRAPSGGRSGAVPHGAPRRDAGRSRSRASTSYWRSSVACSSAPQLAEVINEHEVARAQHAQCHPAQRLQVA